MPKLFQRKVRGLTVDLQIVHPLCHARLVLSTTSIPACIVHGSIKDLYKHSINMLVTI